MPLLARLSHAGIAPIDDPERDVREDLRLIIRFTSYWILYGALTLASLAVVVSAIKGVIT